jgi:hypothetical protein
MAGTPTPGGGELFAAADHGRAHPAASSGYSYLCLLACTAQQTELGRATPEIRDRKQHEQTTSDSSALNILVVL